VKLLIVVRWSYYLNNDKPTSLFHIICVVFAIHVCNR